VEGVAPKPSVTLDPIGGEREVRAAQAIEKTAKNPMNSAKAKNIAQKAQ
jgi:hypothetical protein